MTDNATPVNEKDENNSSSPKKEKESKSSVISDLISTIVGGATGAFVGGVSNPFSGTSSNAESISSGDSSISSVLNSTPSGGDLGTSGKGEFGGDDTQEKSTIEVLSKIYKQLSETSSTIHQIAKDTATLAKNQTQKDIFSDISSVNAKARQNERAGTSSPVYASNRKKAEEDSSILGSIADWFTGGKKKPPKTGQSAADKLTKKGGLESIKDAFSGWGKKEAEKGTAKKIEKAEKKGMLDKLKDAFTGPKAKKIAGGAVIGGAALSLSGDTPTFDGKQLTPSQKENYHKILEEAQRQELSEEETDAALALAYHESGFNENAKGKVIQKGMHKGDRAHGLYQYMQKSSGGWDRNDPQQNIEHGIKDLKENTQKYGLKGAYGAHFAGPGAINPDGTPKTNKSDTQQTITQYQKSVDKVAQDLKRQRQQNSKNNSTKEPGKKDNSIGNIPPLSENNTSSTKPEITGKNGKQIALTGDTNRNPYFGKETTPYEENNAETASAFVPAAYNPDTEPATVFSGAQFPNNESKPKKSTQNELKPLGYTLSDDESGKLDPPKSMIRQVKLADGETKNWKVDLESGEETLATEDDINQDKQQKELEKQYDEKQQSSSSLKPEVKTDPLSYTVETPGENSKVTTTKGSSSKSPGEFRTASETTTVTTTGGGSTLRVQEQSEEEKAKLAKEDADQKEKEKARSSAAYDPLQDNGTNNHSKYKLTGKRILDHEPNAQEKEVLDIDQKRATLMNERTNLERSGVNVDDKETMDKQLERLSGISTEMKQLDEKRNNITGSKEYLDNIEKQKSGGKQQSSSNKKSSKSSGGGGSSKPKGNDDPTLKLMEEGTNINHNSELTA
jgi:hypothetical protein